MNNRMSAIGITVIEDGKIADEYYSLVNPESQFDSFNTRLTGISGKTVRNAPAFPEVWKQIEPMMSDGLLVAHNAASSDSHACAEILLRYIESGADVKHFIKTLFLN